MSIIKWDDVVERYERVSQVGGSVEVSAYITYAQAEIESRLAPFYTTPFSDNNLTAKDLVIDLTYAKILAYKDEKKAKAIRDILDRRIERLASGEESMITTSGDIFKTSGSSVADSTTINYHPTFGMDDYRFSQVSSDMLQNEEDQY